MTSYTALLRPGRGLQPYVIVLPTGTFKVYGQPLTVYARSPAFRFEDLRAATEAPYVTIQVPEGNHLSFLWVWSHLNGISPPNIGDFGTRALVYPMLRSFGIHPTDKAMKAWMKDLLRKNPPPERDDTLLRLAASVRPTRFLHVKNVEPRKYEVLPFTAGSSFPGDITSGSKRYNIYTDSVTKVFRALLYAGVKLDKEVIDEAVRTTNEIRSSKGEIAVDADDIRYAIEQVEEAAALPPRPLTGRENIAGYPGAVTREIILALELAGRELPPRPLISIGDEGGFAYRLSEFDNVYLGLNPGARPPSIARFLPEAKPVSFDPKKDYGGFSGVGYFQIPLGSETLLWSVGTVIDLSTLRLKGDIFPQPGEEDRRAGYVEAARGRLPSDYSAFLVRNKIPESIKILINAGTDVLWISTARSGRDIGEAAVRIDGVWRAVTDFKKRVSPGDIIPYILEYSTDEALFRFKDRIEAGEEDLGIASYLHQTEAIQLMMEKAMPLVPSIPLYFGKKRDILVNAQPLVSAHRSLFFRELFSKRDLPYLSLLLPNEVVDEEALRYVLSWINGLERPESDDIPSERPSFSSLLTAWTYLSYFNVPLQSGFPNTVISDLLVKAAGGTRTDEEKKRIMRILKEIPKEDRKSMAIFKPLYWEGTWAGTRTDEIKRSDADGLLSVIYQNQPRDMVFTVPYDQWRPIRTFPPTPGLTEETHHGDVLVVWSIIGDDGKPFPDNSMLPLFATLSGTFMKSTVPWSIFSVHPDVRYGYNEIAFEQDGTANVVRTRGMKVERYGTFTGTYLRIPDK